MAREKLEAPKLAIRRGLPEDHYFQARYDLTRVCEGCGCEIRAGELYRRIGWTEGDWNGCLGVRHRLWLHQECEADYLRKQGKHHGVTNGRAGRAR